MTHHLILDRIQIAHPRDGMRGRDSVRDGVILWPACPHGAGHGSAGRELCDRTGIRNSTLEASMPTVIRRMVVGVATWEEEDAALSSAVRLALATGAALEVVHVSPEAQEGVGPGRTGRHRPWQIQAALQQQVRRLSPEPERPVVRCRLRSGSVGETLSEMAREVEADLLIVGATRRGALARRILGTTAQRVLHGASCPMLVVRASLQVPLRRALFTTDLSELSEGVYERATELLDALFPRDSREVRSLFVEEGTEFRPGAREQVAAGAHIRHAEFLQLSRPGTFPFMVGVRVGNAAQEIVADTVEWVPDLLVLGTHGRTGAARTFLGSVAEAALRSAPCSVLVVPAAAVAREMARLSAREIRLGIQVEGDRGEGP